MKTLVSLALGGNIGDTRKIFDQAAAALERGGFAVSARSGVFVTAPVDCDPGTPDFLNAAVTGFWEKSPRELLELTRSIERASGRPAEHSSRKARTLDIDIITFGDMIVSEPDLVIPHPRAQLRRFVLEPLFAIAPDLTFPDSGLTVRRLLSWTPCSR